MTGNVSTGKFAEDIEVTVYDCFGGQLHAQSLCYIHPVVVIMCIYFCCYLEDEGTELTTKQGLKNGDKGNVVNQNSLFRVERK